MIWYLWLVASLDQILNVSTHVWKWGLKEHLTLDNISPHNILTYHQCNEFVIRGQWQLSILSMNHGDKCKWNLNHNTTIFQQDNEHENGAGKMWAILYWTLMQCFNVFFVGSLDNLWNKKSSRRWFEMTSCSCDVIGMMVIKSLNL